MRGTSLVVARVPAQGLELELLLPSRSTLSVMVLDQHLRSSPRIDELRQRCGPECIPRRSGDTFLVCASFSL